MRSSDNIEQANRRAGELQTHAPRAVSVVDPIFWTKKDPFLR